VELDGEHRPSLRSPCATRSPATQRGKTGREALEKLSGRVLVRAEDRDSAVTLDFSAGSVRIRDGEQEGARIRVLGDQDAMLALTRLLTIRGLVLRSRSVLRLLRLLAA
jgi:hypothetical protein